MYALFAQSNTSAFNIPVYGLQELNLIFISKSIPGYLYSSSFIVSTSFEANSFLNLQRHLYPKCCFSFYKVMEETRIIDTGLFHAK